MTDVRKHAGREVVRRGETSRRAALVMCTVLGTAALVVATAVRSAGSNASVAALPSAAVFGALPQVSDVELSPDGNLLAWCDQSSMPAKVVIFDLVARKYRRTLDIDPAMKLRSLLWADGSTLLVNVSDTAAPQWIHLDAYEMFRTLAVRVDSGESHMLLMGEGEKARVTGANLVAWHTAKPNTIVMATLDYAPGAHQQELGSRLGDARADSGWVWRLFDVDTHTGEGKVIDQGDPFTVQWVVDAQGLPVARSEWRPAQHRYWIEAKAGQGWRTILERTDGSQMVLSGVSADGKSVVAIGPGQGGSARLWAVALDGSGAKDLLPQASADVEHVVRDRFSGLPVAAELGGLTPGTRWLDAAAEARYQSVAHAFAGREVAVYSRSEDGSRVIAEVEGPSTPPVYYLIDFKAHRADIVGDAYPELDNAALGQVRSITYPARDGTAIPAYLTLPPGSAPKGLPMVVLPHGGPADRDVPKFDWLAQFFATRGYAVLQPQFRGSTGFGAAFERAGARQWGGLMQDDVTDGVKAMIQQGIADSHRICIVGASYGGYTALAGAAFTPDLYACAVSINGVSDLPAIMLYYQHHSGIPESDEAAYLQQEIGAPSDQGVIDHSPVNAAEAVKVPVLLLHATDDTVVPAGQSEEMAQALARFGKPVTFVKLVGEDHWLSRAQTRVEVLENADRFLRQYLH